MVGIVSPQLPIHKHGRNIRAKVTKYLHKTPQIYVFREDPIPEIFSFGTPCDTNTDTDGTGHCSSSGEAEEVAENRHDVFRYEEEREDMRMVSSLQYVLDLSLQLNATSEKSFADGLEDFGNEMPLNILASEYIAHIAKWSACNTNVLLVAMLYLERLQKWNQGMLLTPYNFQRLYIVAVMVAEKFLSDHENDRCTNSRWAQIGDIPVKELNKLEIAFLFGLKFDILVSAEDYSTFCRPLALMTQL